MKYKGLLIPLIIIGAIISITGCPASRSDDIINGRTHVIYWEKWTGFERDAMKEVVQKFNDSQNKIYIDFLAVSEIDKKTMVAIAGGDPPDIAGLWQNIIPNFTDKNALTPLDDYALNSNIKKEDYLPIFWSICMHRKHLYALPTTPASVALHWNKRLFKEAGLDPDRPPKTLQELDQYAEKLTKRDKQGKITQIGFLPVEPGWWNWAWGFWFGGKLWDGKDKILCNSPENIKAYEWVQSYSKKYGMGSLQSFRSGFGNFASPQNAFLSEKVAMEVQGVWMYNFINNYNPKLKWACAPFPSAVPGMNDIVYMEADSLCIPRGARHPKEAFEFIKFVQQRENMEMLCMGQRKFTPLSSMSDDFQKKHPNPYIKMFIDLATSPNAFTTQDMSIWNEYVDEMNNAFDDIWLENKTPKQALDLVQQRIQKKWNKELVRFNRLGWTIN